MAAPIDDVAALDDSASDAASGMPMQPQAQNQAVERGGGDSLQQIVCQVRAAVNMAREHNPELWRQFRQNAVIQKYKTELAPLLQCVEDPGTGDDQCEGDLFPLLGVADEVLPVVDQEMDALGDAYKAQVAKCGGPQAAHEPQAAKRRLLAATSKDVQTMDSDALNTPSGESSTNGPQLQWQDTEAEDKAVDKEEEHMAELAGDVDEAPILKFLEDNGFIDENGGGDDISRTVCRVRTAVGVARNSKPHVWKEFRESEAVQQNKQKLAPLFKCVEDSANTDADCDGALLEIFDPELQQELEPAVEHMNGQLGDLYLNAANKCFNQGGRKVGSEAVAAQAGAGKSESGGVSRAAVYGGAVGGQGFRL